MMNIKDIFENQIKSRNELSRPYVIAEIGVNHEGSMLLAKRLISEAKDAGADAVKFQAYRADTIASVNSPAYWDTKKEPIKTQHTLFKKHEGFWKNEMQELLEYCKNINIEFMCTPFDVESALFLNEMMDVFKISSSDITNKPFIEYICDFSKPIILSTGASNLSEINEAVSWIEKKGNKLALLHCVLNYPTPDENANLGMILDLKQKFPDNIIGYSDHTLPNDMKTCEIAFLLGSQIIEKHFTHDKSLPGNDHYHAMDKNDLKVFVSSVEKALNLLGKFKVESLLCEDISRANARRSLVTSRPIPKGNIINEEDLTFKRPASGISPKFIEQVIGKTAKRAIESDEIMQWNLIE